MKMIAKTKLYLKTNKYQLNWIGKKNPMIFFNLKTTLKYPD